MELTTTPTARHSAMRVRQSGTLKKRCTNNRLVGQKRRGITLRDETTRNKRSRNVCAFVPGAAGVARDVVNGNVKLTFGSQNQVIALTGQANLSARVSDTKGNTCSVLRVVEDTHTFTTGDKKVDPPDSFSKSCNLSSVVATRCSS